MSEPKERFNVFDVNGTVYLEDHREGSYHIGRLEDVDVNCLNNIADRLNQFSKENDELRLRLMDAVISSDNKPCNCSPCVVRETIVENVLLKK